MDTMRIYVFNNEATAEAFKLTAFHFGYEVSRVGSAVVMEPEVYATIRKNTYATPATLIGEEVDDDNIAEVRATAEALLAAFADYRDTDWRVDQFEEDEPAVKQLRTALAQEVPEHPVRKLCYRHHCREFDTLTNDRKHEASHWVTVDSVDCELCKENLQ